MFKKRTTNNTKEKQQGQQHSSSGFVKRHITSNGGIDLRKDIQQLESNIKQNKGVEKSGKLEGGRDERKEKEEQEERQGYQVPKTKKINKFTSHIMNKLPTIMTNTQNTNNTATIQQLTQQKKHPIQQLINNQGVKLQQAQTIKQNPRQLTQQPSNLHNKQSQLVKPVLANYGLLDKSHFNHDNSQQQQTKITQPSIENTKIHRTHQQTLMDYYIKKKMDQLTNIGNVNISSNLNISAQGATINPLTTGLQQPTTAPNTYTLRQRPTQTWQQVLQIQNQYLIQQQKIKSYSIEEVEKKLEKQAQQIIKTEIQKRAVYLKDMLENEYERMEYASKKELKMIKQDKDRIEKELNSKYKDTGRRHYIDTIKNSML